jgi:hypothetical protein
MAWWLGVIGALVLGAAGNLTYDLVKHQSLRLPKLVRWRQQLPADVRSFDSITMGLHPIVTWSRKRRLDENRVRTSYAGRRHDTHVFDRPEWHAAVERERRKGTAGRTAYLTRIDIDHGEHPAAFSAGFVITESDYAECMATLEIARNGGAVELTSALRAGLDNFLDVVPPTLFFVSVGVLAKSGRLLCLRRSVGVRTAPGMWSIGINETMKYEVEPGREEDLFALVRRGLREELGLEPDDYGKITVTWLGWSAIASGFYAVAFVRARLDEAEIEDRRLHCHSVYEHDLTAWLSLTKKEITKVIRGGPSPDGVHPWITELSPVVAAEAWRFRGEL